jgi:hypothetical protein
MELRKNQIFMRKTGDGIAETFVVGAVCENAKGNIVVYSTTGKTALSKELDLNWIEIHHGDDEPAPEM